MPNDDFPWDLFIIPVCISLIIGFCVSFFFFPGYNNATNEENLVSECMPNSELEQNEQKKLDIFTTQLEYFCGQITPNGYLSFSTVNGDVACCRGMSCLSISSIAEEYTKNKISDIKLQESNEFINAYLPNEYYCITTVPVKYALPVKVHFDVEKTRTVNQTIPVFEYFKAELIISPQTKVNLNGQTLINDKYFKVLTNHSISLSTVYFEELLDESFDIYGPGYQSEKYEFKNPSDENTTVIIRGKIQVGDEEQEVEETYTEDVYDYKEKTQEVYKVIRVEVPLDLTLNERKKLKEEMESNHCYLTPEEANQNANVNLISNLVFVTKTKLSNITITQTN